MCQCIVYIRNGTIYLITWRYIPPTHSSTLHINIVTGNCVEWQTLHSTYNISWNWKLFHFIEKLYHRTFKLHLLFSSEKITNINLDGNIKGVWLIFSPCAVLKIIIINKSVRRKTKATK